MKKIYSLILMTAFFLLGAVNSNAQNEVTTNLSELTIVKDYGMTLEFTEGKQYEDKTFTLEMPDIYEVLGTNATDFDAVAGNQTYTQVIIADDSSGKTVYSWSDNLELPSNASGGSWYGRYYQYDEATDSETMLEMNAPLTWNTSASTSGAVTNTFYLQNISLADGVFTIGASGQFPNIMKEGDTDWTYLYIINANKAARVKVGVNISRPAVDVTTNLSELTIVKDYEMTLEFTEGRENEGKTFTLEMPDIYEVLGTNAEEFDPVAGDQTYTQVIISDNSSGETVYSWSDKLELPSDASSGAWYGRYYQYNEATGSETLIEMNAPQAWGSSNSSGSATNTYYLQQISLADGVFTIGSSGQFKNVMKEGDTDWTYLYIINADKAARVKVGVNIIPPEVIDPDQMVLVGETTIEISADIDDSYATTSFTIDMESILAALGAEASDIADVYAWASEGVMGDNHTEGAGGYYYNEEGFITSWGSNASHFIAPDGSKSDALANGTWKIGQMQGHFTNITESTTVKGDLIFQVGQNYYIVHVLYTVEVGDVPEDPNPENNFDIVFTQPLTLEIVPSGNYYVDEPSDVKEKMCTQLDLDAIASLLGEGKYEFYGQKAPADSESYPTLTKSTGYTPNTGFSGGFWMGKPVADLGDKYVHTAWVKGWGDNAYGIEWNLTTGIIGVDQYPGANEVGAFYNSTFYLVNTTNNKTIKYNVTVNYVSEYSLQGEVVGSSTISGALSDDDKSVDGYYYVGPDISTTDVFTTLEIDPSEIADCTWMITNQTGNLVAAPTSLEGENITLDVNGRYLDTLANPDLLSDVVFTVAFDEDAKRFYYSMFVDIEEGTIYSTTVGLMKSGKIYTFKISAGEDSTITGITNVETSKAVDGNIYDLSGRRITTPAKGLYIKNGKKYMVK